MNDGHLFDNGSFQCKISLSLSPSSRVYFPCLPPPPPKFPIHPEGSLSNADPTPRWHSKGARICSDLPNSPQELDYPQHTCTPIQVITQQLSALPLPSMNRATPPLLVQVRSQTTMGREPQRSGIRTKDKGGTGCPTPGLLPGAPRALGLIRRGGFPGTNPNVISVKIGFVRIALGFAQ